MPAKQVIQDSRLDAKVAVLSPPPPQASARGRPNRRHRARETRADVLSRGVIYLLRERWTLFFPLWERRRNFQTPSSEESNAAWDVLWKSRSVFPPAELCHAKTLLHRRRVATDPSRPIINSLLLFQIVNSCASYYPSSCGYSPLLDEEGEKKGNERRLSLGLGVFLCLRAISCPCVRCKSRTTLFCEAMAPLRRLRAARMRVRFPLFSTRSRQQREGGKKFDTSTRFSTGWSKLNPRLFLSFIRWSVRN